MTWMFWVNLLSPVVIAVLGWSIKNTIKGVTDRVDKLETWQTAVRRDLEEKASREDFIRESARNRQTLEKLIEGQARLEGMLDVGTRIATGIERLSEKHDG